ncbi:hypothetical protein, partial [Methylotuvimicrobium alcaliphilum]|uniref:Sulfate transporter n=1 Tax=Methylotuvimicrobium alcaliphilum (strain DSM 19304 / NCIMB 14124 / VKM B-2133 / 20Z) TaxID=1091494 RepID=G4T2Z9_META2
MIAGIILMLMGVFGLGKYAKLVPNSINEHYGGFIGQPILGTAGS